MANLTTESPSLMGRVSSSSSCCSSDTFWTKLGGELRRKRTQFHFQSNLISFTIRASQSMEDKNKVYKELGLFSLKKKIDDAVVRAEMLAPALAVEEARQIKQEDSLREYNLWDDLSKSNEFLIELADTTRAVDALKDLRYKAEEAKLITQLAEVDAINYRLFKQAYRASVDVSKFLDQYEMTKLLNGPYDMEGACVIIGARSEGVHSEVWVEQILNMYLKWGTKQGYKGRIVDKYRSENGVFKSVTLEFESKYAFGYLSGERGVHSMIRSSHDESILREISLATVDVIPLFLETTTDVQIDEKDIVCSSLSPEGEDQPLCRTKPAVSIRHIPTGIRVLSSDERSHFANKIKALNRLKAKLLVIVAERGLDNVKDIKKSDTSNIWKQETRRYFFHPYKLIQDLKTGIQLPDLISILDGNIEPLIGANISLRQTNDTI